MNLGPYRTLLRLPAVRALLGTSLVAELTAGMVPLLIVLLVHDATGSYATAGGVVAALTAGTAILAPLRGRMVDLHGHTRVLTVLVLVQAAGLAELVAAAEAGAAPVLLAVIAAVTGAAAPPLLPAARTLWRDVVPDDHLDSAYGLQAMLVEVQFIIGPLLASASVAVASPGAGLVLAAVLLTAGGLGFVAMPASRRWRGEPQAGDARGALATPGMRTLLAVTAGLGLVFGTLDVLVPGFATEQGSRDVAGVPLAALAAGSLAGGALYTAHRWSLPAAARMTRLLVGLTVALLVLPLAGSLLALALLMVVAGLAVAPVSAASFAVVDDVAAPGTATEAGTWLVTGYAGGVAGGAAAAGVLLEAVDLSLALLAPAGAAAVALAVALAGRGSLRAPVRA